MKIRICFLLLFLLCPTVRATEIPKELLSVAPHSLQQLWQDSSYHEGLSFLWQSIQAELTDLFRLHLADCIRLLLVIVLCSMVDSVWTAKQPYLNLVGAFAIASLSAGSLHSMMALSFDAMEQIDQFSKVLLPTLASAIALSGNCTQATVWQVGTVFGADLLLTLIDRLFAPLVYLYFAIVTANAILTGERLRKLAVALKKGITWCLTGGLTLFTSYLTISGAVSASADTLTLKATKFAVSASVPVVGNILSKATDSMLSGAIVLKQSIGIFGMLGILSILLLPVVELSIQYLVYKLTAFLASSTGSEPLVKLVDDFGSGFGLLVGMTASCGVILLISLTMAIRVVGNL